MEEAGQLVQTPPLPLPLQDPCQCQHQLPFSSSRLQGTHTRGYTVRLQHKTCPPFSSLLPHSRHTAGTCPWPIRMRTMYQYCSSYQDHALRPYFSNFPSQQDHRNPPSPLPAPPHCYDLLSSQLQPYCSPSSAPHGFSPPPAVGAGGSFTGPATAAATSPSVPASFIRSSGSSVDGFLSLHSHLLDGVHHNSHVVGSGGGGMNGSPELYEHQNEYLDLHSAMQGTKCPQPPQGAGSCTQEMGGAAEVMVGGRVRRYTAEERKERIERYRSKRNQRNFQKKITYACRKTLADSRPRVRGRFVRNDEGEAEPEAEADAGDVSSCNTSPPQTGDDHRFVAWRPATDNEDVEYGCVDPVVWANFLDTISLNNPMIY